MPEINEIKRQFEAGQWKQFLRSIKVSNLHGWTGQKVTFGFPVCAIVGENGIGKSTFIKSAACAYQNKGMKTFYPSNLFVKTQWDSNAIDNAQLEYEILQGERQVAVRWKKTNDWGITPKSNRPERRVYFLDISRTLPLDATAGYAKIAKQSVQESGQNTVLNQGSIEGLSFVLGRNYTAARFTGTEVSAKKEIGLLTSNFGEISQFHQGAGEDATLDLFRLLQDIPDYSLLIIDEIEASLHPQAQRRLVRHLLKLARVKKLQIIVSTHSSYILEELPSEGRIMLFQTNEKKEVFNGISAKFALSAIDEKEHPEFFVFVEDEESQRIVWELIKCSEKAQEWLKRIAVKPIGSCTVVDIIGDLLNHNKLPYKGMAVIDGDKADECPHCIKLPGSMAPELLVFQELKQKNWQNLDERFGIGAGYLFKILNDSMLISDHHLWTEFIGNKIKQDKDYVWSILVEEWRKSCLGETALKQFLESFEKLLK